jgi:GTP-binding protein
VLAFNKMDVTDAEAKRSALEALSGDLRRPAFFISAAARDGTQELVEETFKILARIWEEEPALAPAAERPQEVLRPQPRQPQFYVEREAGGYRVSGEHPVRLVQMLALQSDESRAEAFRRLRRMGVSAALRRAGAREGDSVLFGQVELRWEE